MRATLVLGVTASVCVNVLHAQHNPIARGIAAWPPLALMLTVELISRVPVYRRPLAVVRLLATACIAGIAAYVSYFHMAAVVSRFGEHQPNPYLLPISVDGLIVVASVSLVELAGRVRTPPPPSGTSSPSGSPTVDEPTQPDAETAPPVARAAQSCSNGHGGATPEATRPLTAAPPLPTALSLSLSPQASVMAVAPLEPDIPATPTPPPQVTAPPRADQRIAEPPFDHLEARCYGNIDPELAAKLPVARAARDALQRNGRSLTRDSLAAQLRRDGHTISTSRVSTLLNLLRNDEGARVNGRSLPD